MLMRMRVFIIAKFKNGAGERAKDIEKEKMRKRKKTRKAKRERKKERKQERKKERNKEREKEMKWKINEPRFRFIFRVKNEIKMAS